MTSDQNTAPEAYAEPQLASAPVAWQAITSLVLGVLALLLLARWGGLGLFAIGFGADALWRIKRGWKTGRGMAIAGTALGAFTFGVTMIGIITGNS